MSKTPPTQFEQLASPFTWSEVEVKPGSVNGDQAKAIVYFDARAVRERLTRVLELHNWGIDEQSFFPVGGKSGCQVRVWALVDGNKITAYGEDDLSDIEPIKGGKSGAFKRAFSELANDTLYTLGDFGWWSFDKNGQGKFKGWTKASLKGMQARYEAHFKGEFIGDAPDLDESPAVETIRGMDPDQAKAYCKACKVTPEDYEVIKNRCLQFREPLGTFFGLASHAGCTGRTGVLDFLWDRFPLTESELSVSAQKPLGEALSEGAVV